MRRDPVLFRNQEGMLAKEKQQQFHVKLTAVCVCTD